MAELATLLLRTVARAFYTTEHILVVDALIRHGTLPDTDLAYLLSMQPKSLRKLCGRLKEDGLLSVQTRAERKTDGSQAYFGGGGAGAAGGGKERVSYKDWYYLNFHRAIDSIKYRMYRLNKHVESLGAPRTEKKDLACPNCKAQYTELEVMDRIDVTSGEFMCRRCGHTLAPISPDEVVSENETMKRLNSQLEKILRLMQQIDATNVPENDFQTALANQKPVLRAESNPGQGRYTEIVDLPGRHLQSTKGLDIKPEKIAVQVQDDETVKRESEAAEAQARREREARQNALPDWIVKSTVSGDITAAGAKEERLRRERESTSALARVEDETSERKPAKDGEEDVMKAYWEELAKAQAEEAARARASDDEEDEDEDDEDEFEDVDVGAGGATPAVNGSAAQDGNGTKGSTPALESSNATDDERDAKRPKIEESTVASSSRPTNGNAEVRAEGRVAEDTPAASDEDEDDEVEFEDV